MLLAALLMDPVAGLMAQCTNATPYVTVAAPANTTPLTISYCTFPGEYNTVTGLVAGAMYSVSTDCGAYITVRHTTYNGALVANGNGPVSFTAPVSGTYFLHFNTNAACGTASVCCTTTITCTSCGGGGGGCLNTSAYGSATAPTTNTAVTISTCNYQTEYSTITGVVAGVSYTLSNSCGGYITVRQGVYNGPVVAQGTSSLTFTATVSGTYYVHYNTNAACGTATNCCTTTIACTSCTGGPPPGACTAINIPSLPLNGQPMTCHGSNLITSANLTSICGSGSTLYLGGYEALYTVTPTVTENYVITYTGQGWSSIWVFSSNCPAAGGICQGSVSGSAATQSLTLQLTAGVQYWILFDTWPSPDSPCPGSFSITTSNVPPPVTASDCNQAVSVCTNINFQINPNGYGTVYEIPALGSYGNPDLYAYDGLYSSWGSDNYGCLRSGELNSTWMVVNVLTGGTLTFTFGGLGTQTGFYDWIMYPYNANACTQVAANLVAPVRCNWNGASYGGTGLASTIPPGGDPSNFEPPLTVGSYTQWLICFSNWSSVTTSVPLQFGGTAVVSCSTLPVELLSFDAARSGLGVALEWVTATERSTSRFVIERSADGGAWTAIDSVAAAGASVSPIVYKHLDAAPLPGHGYYRLRIIDTDGSWAHSPVAHVLYRPAQASGLIGPNPTSGAFWVRAAGRLLVIDALGRSVPFRLLHAEDDMQEVVLPSATPGVYTLMLGEGEDMRIDRVVLR